MNCNLPRCNVVLDRNNHRYALFINTANGVRHYCCHDHKNEDGYGPEYENTPLFPPSRGGGSGGGGPYGFFKEHIFKIMLVGAAIVGFLMGSGVAALVTLILIFVIYVVWGAYLGGEDSLK